MHSGRETPGTEEFEGGESMLQFKELTKQYGNFTALDRFTVDLESGIYALLGPNGAGKSTMMNILVGLIAPTNGCIYYDGTDISKMDDKFRDIIGYMPQYPGFYPNFTAMDLMRYMAQMKGIPRKDAEKPCLKLLTERFKCARNVSGPDHIAVFLTSCPPAPQQVDSVCSLIACHRFIKGA